MNCPYSVEECRKRRATIVYPEGKPQGLGLFENIKKPKIIQVNCMCLEMLLKELKSELNA